MIKIILLLLLIHIFIIGVSPVACQASSPMTCEVNNLTLNVAHHIAKERNLIFIARLGSGESRNDLNRRRLHNVSTYLEMSFNRSPKTIILAEGERVSGYGRIEIYLEGKLADTISVNRNSDITVGSCEPEFLRPKSDELFYPLFNAKPKKIRKIKGE